MGKNKDIDLKQVRSINKNVRSSVRKLKPILKSIVGKKVEIAIRDLSFSEKRISKDIKKTKDLTVDFSDKIKNSDYEIRFFLKSKMYNNKNVLKKNNR